MGYRANVITQHREYGSHFFSDYTQFEEYFVFLREEYRDDELYEAENLDYFEIGKDVGEKEIKRLTELGLDEEFEFKSSWHDNKTTNKEVVESWKTALAESPTDSSYVSLEWF